MYSITKGNLQIHYYMGYVNMPHLKNAHQAKRKKSQPTEELNN